MANDEMEFKIVGKWGKLLEAFKSINREANKSGKELATKLTGALQTADGAFGTVGKTAEGFFNILKGSSTLAATGIGLGITAISKLLTLTKEATASAVKYQQASRITGIPIKSILQLKAAYQDVDLSEGEAADALLTLQQRYVEGTRHLRNFITEQMRLGQLPKDFLVGGMTGEKIDKVMSLIRTAPMDAWRRIAVAQEMFGAAGEKMLASESKGLGAVDTSMLGVLESTEAESAELEKQQAIHKRLEAAIKVTKETAANPTALAKLQAENKAASVQLKLLQAIGAFGAGEMAGKALPELKVNAPTGFGGAILIPNPVITKAEEDIQNAVKKGLTLPEGYSRDFLARLVAGGIPVQDLIKIPPGASEEMVEKLFKATPIDKWSKALDFLGKSEAKKTDLLGKNLALPMTRVLDKWDEWRRIGGGGGGVVGITGAPAVAKTPAAIAARAGGVMTQTFAGGVLGGIPGMIGAGVAAMGTSQGVEVLNDIKDGIDKLVTATLNPKPKPAPGLTSEFTPASGGAQ